MICSITTPLYWTRQSGSVFSAIMAELFEEDFFNKRQTELKKQSGSQRWLTILFVIVLIAIAAGALYWWSKNNPETMILDINQASVEQLQYLPGIGPVTAKDIVSGRPYESIDDLKKVKGIGEKTFLQIKPRVKLD